MASHGVVAAGRVRWNRLGLDGPEDYATFTFHQLRTRHGAMRRNL